MKLAAVTIGLVLLSANSHAADPGATWPTRTPAQAGLNVAKLNELRAATGWTSGSTTFRGFVVKNGFQVYSWGNVAQKGDWASAIKPVITTAKAIAIKEGRITGMNDRVGRFGWAVTQPDASITFAHLGNMVSGYGLPENPGAAWAYNDWGVALDCRTLFTQPGDAVSAFGQTMTQVIHSRLASLQFQDGGVVGAGRNGCQLFASIRDAARLGQFWMNRGRWRGVQIIPAAFFTSFWRNLVSATLPRTAGSPTNDYLMVAGSTGGGPNQTQFDGRGRYGSYVWFNSPKRAWTSAPTDAFAAIGHHNAEPIFVIPSLQIVFTCKCRNSAANGPAIVADGNQYLRLLVEAHQ